MSKLRTFKSYEHYVEEQTKTNKRKLKGVTITDEEIQTISKYIKQKIETPKYGICHGTRNGYEIKGFRKHLGIDVIGTEI